MIILIYIVSQMLQYFIYPIFNTNTSTVVLLYQVYVISDNTFFRTKKYSWLIGQHMWSLWNLRHRLSWCRADPSMGLHPQLMFRNLKIIRKKFTIFYKLLLLMMILITTILITIGLKLIIIMMMMMIIKSS